ncbi:PREDICTED: exportin-4-like isoform X1 [Amphimedon queenslandica]|nr:PREDICTED: exportin-4-like isoform X1 [Amphimedon queenslandica]|eukprot:XP_019852618.1 PREDICTED: exportin-4-like isoform X1 [Amphimedon queenslandica]
MADESVVIAQLEEAARFLFASDMGVPASKREEAEICFNQLRSIPRPYSLCQCILGSNCSSYVKFQATVTMKEAFMREWTQIQPEERHIMLKQLFDFVVANDSSLSDYVQKQIFVLISIVLKRGALEDNGGIVLKSYIHNICQSLCNLLNVEIGCCFLLTLLSEFSSSEGSSSIGLSLDSHFRCKRCIEESGGLLLVITAAMQALASFVNKLEFSKENNISLLVSLNLEILSWDFSSSTLHGIKSVTSFMSNVPLKPPPSFNDILLDPAIVHVFLKLFNNFSGGSDIVVSVCQCLSQLASLSGAIFSSKDIGRSYAINFVKTLISSLMQNLHLSDKALYGITCVFRRFLSNFCHLLFVILTEETLLALSKVLVHLFEISSQRSATIEMSHEDSSMLEESYCFILEGIYRLIEPPTGNFAGYLKESLLTLVTVYLRNKLNHPRGLRQYCTGFCTTLDFTDDDREIYYDELSYLGFISRHILTDFLSMLLDLFNQCYSKCTELIAVLSSSESNTAAVYEIEALFEDIHWLLLIAAFTLTDVVEGEECVIPKQIQSHSFEHQTNDLFTLEQLVYNTDHSNTSSVDPVVSLIVCLCQWCVIEKDMIDKGLKDFVSPQVSESATWSLFTVCNTYLLSSRKYEKMSDILSRMIVSDTDESRWLLFFILDKVLFNTSVWMSEEKLCICSMKLLTKLCQSSPLRSTYLCNSEKMCSFMKACASGQHCLAMCSPSVQREIFKGLVSCASGDKNAEFLNELLGLLYSQFEGLMASFDSQSLNEQKHLLMLLESINGVIVASHNSIVNVVFPFILPILSTCVQIMDRVCDFQDLYQAILKLFCHVSENFLLFLNDVSVSQLYDICSTLVSVYAKIIVGKYCKKMSDDMDYDDLTFFIETLSHLTTKDYIDFSQSDTNDVSIHVDVVLKGLCAILPAVHVNEDLLKYPDICKKFYELLHYVCEIFPESLLTLPTDCIEYTFTLIGLGCVRFGADIRVLSVECIESLSNCSPTVNLDLFIQGLKFFLKELFKEMLMSYHETNTISHFIAAIYQLMCCLKEHSINVDSILLNESFGNNKGVKELLQANQSILTGSKVHRKEFQSYVMKCLPTIRDSCFHTTNNV